MTEKHDEREQNFRIITLIHQSRRFKISKTKLIRKSKYFAVLLLFYYKQYGQSQHEINYEIPSKIFQINFILLIQKEIL